MFESVKDSRNIGRGADFIEEFSRAQGDKIDLSKIDAKAGLAGNQSFHFIGTKEFTQVKGQLRYEVFAFDDDGDGPQRWVSIQADTNRNGISDLEIFAVVVGSIAKSCFIL